MNFHTLSEELREKTSFITVFLTNSKKTLKKAKARVIIVS